MELSKERGVTLLAETTLPGVSMSERLSHSFLELTAIAHALIVSRREKVLKWRKGLPVSRANPQG